MHDGSTAVRAWLSAASEWKLQVRESVRADVWEGGTTKHFSVGKWAFQWTGGRQFSEWGVGKDFYRRGNSVKMSGPFAEPPDSENWKVAVLIAFPKISKLERERERDKRWKFYMYGQLSWGWPHAKHCLHVFELISSGARKRYPRSKKRYSPTQTTNFTQKTSSRHEDLGVAKSLKLWKIILREPFL